MRLRRTVAVFAVAVVVGASAYLLHTWSADAAATESSFLGAAKNAAIAAGPTLTDRTQLIERRSTRSDVATVGLLGASVIALAVRHRHVTRWRAVVVSKTLAAGAVPRRRGPPVPTLV